MTIDLEVDLPLVTLSASFVVDPALADSVDVAYDVTPLHSPTAGPNRYTLHVPTETTRLSLGQKSSRWNTDTGITGYTDSHVHFETRANDQTVVSLGGPATTTMTLSASGAAPATTQGYSMVTVVNAWHDAKLQHYLLSQTADISLRTAGSGKRAVVQADGGKVDVNAGTQVNVSGGGVSIAAAKLQVEDVRYGGSWVGDRPHSSAAGATQIAVSVAGALSALADLIANKVRLKYGEGDFAGAPAEWADRNKWKINAFLLGLATTGTTLLVTAPASPAKCVKLAAAKTLAAMAGGDISIFGVKTASLGSAGWTTVSAGMSASLKATAFGGVGALFASMKGYRKVEMGSDWGKVFVGVEKAIHLDGENNFTAGAKNVAHVASPEAEGLALFGGKKTWIGSPAGGGFGLCLDDAGLALGKATGADKMATAKVAAAPALRITADGIEIKTQGTSMKLDANLCTIEGKNKTIRFEATSGPITVNGAKILLKMTITYDDDPSVPPLLANPQSFVVDPVYASSVEMGFDVVTVAQPTAGPNRYTLHVPTETTALSLGAASSRWRTDKGITGYTDSHVHFEAKTGPQTVVSLGGPAKTASVTGYGGAAPVSTHGYSMVTLSNAWHDAQKQHYLFSVAGDITMRTLGAGKRAVIQADQGIVDLNGAAEVNLAGGGVAIGAHEGLPFEDIKYAGHWSGLTPHSIAAKRAAQFNSISNLVVTAHNLVMSAAKSRKARKPGRIHSGVDTFADVAEWFVDLGEFGRTAAVVKALFSAPEAAADCIKIDAEEDFGVSAGGSASFFGIKGASMGSTVWTSVSGIISASLKGSVFAGVAAAYTSLKGYKKIEIGCDHGDAIFAAKNNVQISADNSFIAVGKKLAQVSAENNAYFTGGETAWIGTSAGGGWGLQFNKGGVMIGKASSADAMKKATIAADRSIKIDKDGFTLTSSSTVMTLTKKSVDAKASSVKFHAKDSDVRVGGKKVLLDGP